MRRGIIIGMGSSPASKSSAGMANPFALVERVTGGAPGDSVESDDDAVFRSTRDTFEVARAHEEMVCHATREIGRRGTPWDLA